MRLTMGSLFSGSGGFELAASMADIRPVWAAEIEPFPIRVTTKRFPQVKHYGDVSRINGRNIEPTDIITFGSPCFPAGTLILTENGFTPIEKIEVGTYVLTHKGRWRKVTDVGKKTGKTVILKDGYTTLECTPEHKIYIGDGKWLEAKKMIGHMWSAPKKCEALYVPQPKNGLSSKLFYIIGKWLINGWITTDTIVIKSHPDQLLEDALMYETDGWRKTNETVNSLFKIYNTEFSKWLSDNFGTSEFNKRIPGWIYSTPQPYIESLLEGVRNSHGKINKSLAFGLKTLAGIAGYSIKIKENAMLRCSESRYSLKFSDNAADETELHRWYLVKKIKRRSKIQNVYNITVEEDHSYVADGIVVKNCQDLSLAGKRAGIEGSRSSLFFEAVRIIKEMRKETNGRYPRYAVWENVPGAFSSNKGEDFRCVLETLCGINEKTEVHIPMPKKGKWSNAGCIMGDTYSIAWRVLDAQYFGVPQRRKRIFLVADLAGGSAGKILFESDSMRGDIEKSGIKGEDAAAIAEKSTGRTMCISDRADVDVLDDVSPTLLSEAHGHVPCIYENHIKDARIKGPLKTAPTVTAYYGTGGNNTPLVKEVYGICAKESGAMTSANPDSGFYKAQTSRTIDANGVNPASNQGGMVIVQEKISADRDCIPFTQNQRNEVRDLGNKSAALCAEPGAKQQTFICKKEMFFGKETNSLYSADSITPTLKARINEDIIAENVFSLQGSTIGRDKKNGPQGNGVNEDISFTLNTADRHAVVYNMSKASFMTRINENITDPLVASDYKDPQIIGKTLSGKEVSGTLNASMGEHRCLGNQEAFSGDYYVRDPKYIVRRLTPLECCRLQGFPDWWCDGLNTEDPTEEDVKFWIEAFEAHRLATDPSKKPKTKNQIIKWLKNPYSDSAVYKMWGNGVALPCVYFVMKNIANAYYEEER